MADDMLYQRIAELERQVAFLMAELGVAAKYASRVMQPSADDDIAALARANRMIDAIKLYRERHRAGLAEAKSAVEAMLAGH